MALGCYLFLRRNFKSAVAILPLKGGVTLLSVARPLHLGLAAPRHEVEEEAFKRALVQENGTQVWR